MVFGKIHSNIKNKPSYRVSIVVLTSIRNNKFAKLANDIIFQTTNPQRFIHVKSMSYGSFNTNLFTYE